MGQSRHSPDWLDDDGAADSLPLQASLLDDDFADEVIARVSAESVRAALKELKQDERVVLTLRFGLGGGRERTLEETGAILGVPAKRVRQIEARALRRLRHPAIRRKYGLLP